ncbi:wax ester/triacylglycerol synthase domain-containing protein [Sinomonas atrocyanea]|uniref:wax ester/triacylglycerol synthase domain-containing protein n=1 Tax=Sinomonas atrocyanea TaxID=37927 RepID=UPI003D98ABA1
MTHASSPIDRISSNDLTVLATDHGSVPMQMAAILEFDAADAPTFAQLEAVMAARIQRVPRLRQRLVRTPPGCGRPVWADDADFTLARHLTQTVGPGGREAVLEIAADLACTRLPLDRPPWTARWVRGATGGTSALVFVAHHVMADGLNGLAVLTALSDSGAGDGAPAPAPAPFPRPMPGRRDLLIDVWRERLAALAHLPARLVGVVRGLRELGVTARHGTHVASTSFNRPTGSTRRIATAAVPLKPVLDLAHARGCTVNDLVLVAVSGAMASTLRARGESPGPFVVSVPISARPGTDVARLGNAVGIVPIEVPSDLDPEVRLARVAAETAARRGSARGSSAAPLGFALRALGRTSLLQRYIDRQRRVNTFLSNMRGPAEPISIAGHRAVSVVPFGLTPGNVGVCFAVVSYAGQLVVTLVADPDVVPELDELAGRLSDELRALTESAPP